MSKESLVKMALDLGFTENEVAVPFEIFFEGNTFKGSIMPNVLPESPDPQNLYNFLKELKLSGDVREIYVRICELNDNWAFSDSIYVYTGLFMMDLEEKFEEFEPDEIKIGWMYDRPNGVSEIEESDQVYTVWWD
ncbi:MAG: hypothetical protein JW982_06950 [Spirochaetes bacterium]|nr:hypothetical protein [Spirochaetota bacterium]